MKFFAIGRHAVLLCALASAVCMAYGQNDCSRQPDFVRSLRFDMNRSGFSTSDKLNRGIVFAEFKDPSNPVEYTRMYQHPSWKAAGYLGTIVFDEWGNIFVAPLPMVNTLYNPVNKKNTIYRIDHETGIMEEFISLPLHNDYYVDNPFGIVGLTYDCELKTLFAATLEGSTAANEKGKIFSIAIESGQVTLLLDSTDALGLATLRVGHSKKLFFGSARTGKVFSIVIGDSSALVENSRLEIDITGQGPRGDDKVRKIKYRAEGILQLYAVEFDYNLIAPTIKQESVYLYKMDPSSGKWLLQY